MRIISGTLKGRRLVGYDIEGTRPTMDRVKESMFASIYGYIADAVVLDLFAGSGNLGIEAISNGASKCYFVDSNKKCIKAIRSNVDNFRIMDNAFVLERDYHNALKYFSDNNIRFDIIFIDPPYKYQIKEELFKLIYEYDILTENGIIVFEYQNDEEVNDSYNFSLIKNKKYGDKYVSIYKRIEN